MDPLASDHQCATPTVRHRRHERPGATPVRDLVSELAPGGRHRKPDPSPVARTLQDVRA